MLVVQLVEGLHGRDPLQVGGQLDQLTIGVAICVCVFERPGGENAHVNYPRNVSRTQCDQIGRFFKYHSKVTKKQINLSWF